MRLLKCLYFCTAICVIILFFYYNFENNAKYGNSADTIRKEPAYINIGVVACAQRFHETLSMLKSALIFNTEPQLNFIIFCESHLKSMFENRFQYWQQVLGCKFMYKINDLKFPSENSIEWKNLFKPCASQRLFLPSLLKAEDTLLYVDTDVVFLSPVSEIFASFSKFNSSQIAALALEHEDEQISWYSRFARHPYFGNTGLNSGVMLMNLTRMREFEWEHKILPLYDEYRLKITWGDQDLINILFYFNPDKLYLIPCSYNYRPDHCMYTDVCNINKSGIQIIHGNRGYLHSLKQPLFKHIYDAVENYQLGTSLYHNFYLPLREVLFSSNNINSNCGKLSMDILNQINNYLQNKENILGKFKNKNSFLSGNKSII